MNISAQCPFIISLELSVVFQYLLRLRDFAQFSRNCAGLHLKSLCCWDNQQIQKPHSFSLDCWSWVSNFLTSDPWTVNYLFWSLFHILQNKAHSYKSITTLQLCGPAFPQSPFSLENNCGHLYSRVSWQHMIWIIQSSDYYNYIWVQPGLWFISIGFVKAIHNWNGWRRHLNQQVWVLMALWTMIPLKMRGSYQHFKGGLTPCWDMIEK